MNLFRFVDAEKADLPVSLLCHVLGVPAAATTLERPHAVRSRKYAVLTEKIREVHERSRETYGHPRVHAELRAFGVVGADAGGWRWADMMYVPTEEGFLYVAFVLDAQSRGAVGWSMNSYLLRTELVIDALEMAVWRRKPPSGLVHHSDRNAEYTALFLGERLREVGILPSMGRAGLALAEQRDGRELRIDAQGEVGGPSSPPHEGGGEDGRLRVRRRVLQPSAEALVAVLRKPSRS